MKTAIIVDEFGSVFCGRKRYRSKKVGLTGLTWGGYWFLELWRLKGRTPRTFRYSPMVFDSKRQAEQMAKKLAGKVAVVT